jgi:diguanylate cyclase (GGDEF)-like protein
MLSQETINVLLIALGANAIVVVALIVAPRLRGTSQRREDAARDHAASAARPSFPTNGHAVAATAPLDPVVVPMPYLASSTEWFAWLAEESARAARYQRPATVVLVELTWLDRLADRVGRPAADRLIAPVATTLRGHARAADQIARLSSTRFGVLLVETDEISAINYIERIRSACDLWLASGAVALRLSIGWAEIGPERSGLDAASEAEVRLFDERRRLEPVERPTGGGGEARPAFQPSGG